MPPEIAMVTLKRYWSGQINNAEILELCSHYQPAQLLLKPDMIDDDWRKFLGGYTMVYQDKTLNFYLQKLR